MGIVGGLIVGSIFTCAYFIDDRLKKIYDKLDKFDRIWEEERIK
jgi:hypothetical protein